MTPSKKRPAKSASIRPLRSPTSSPRSLYLKADVSKDQKRQILEYCNKRKISVSEFLAQVVLDEAAHSEPTEKAEIQLTLTLPVSQLSKLDIFAHRNDKTVAELVEELLQPELKKTNTSNTIPLETLIYYVSKDEKKRIAAHLKKKGLTTRSYVGFLALKAIGKH